MRAEFTMAMEGILGADPSSLLVTGDLGFNSFETIASVFSSQFLNAGVAEQNMMGLGAGLALSGYKPWIYSIVPFVTLRCLEQIRNDVCFHNLPVRIVGNGGGFTYGIMGSTHHALEDLGALKSMPNLTLWFPASEDQVSRVTSLIHAQPGPTYLRLGRGAFPSRKMPLSEHPVTLTRRYSQGEGCTVIGVGHASQSVVSASERFPDHFRNASIFSVSRFPFDLTSDHDLSDSVAKTKRVLVVEEHYRAGGMGESLASVFLRLDMFEILSAVYSPDHRGGSPKFHLQQTGLLPEDIAIRVKELSQ